VALHALEQKIEVPGNVSSIVEAIRPVVEKSEDRLIDSIVRMHVKETINVIKQSPVLSPLINEKKLNIVGAVYELETGAVDFNLA
jgi:carbonic anhydrase